MFLVVDSACVCVGGGGGEHACVFVIFALLVTDVCWDSETVTSSFAFTIHAISSNDYMSILASFSVVFNL